MLKKCRILNSSAFSTTDVFYGNSRYRRNFGRRKLSLDKKVVRHLNSLGVLPIQERALLFVKNVCHAINLVQRGFIGVPYQRYIFCKVAVKRGNCDELSALLASSPTLVGNDNKEKAPLRKGVVASLQSFDFVDGKSCLCRDYIQRNFGVTEPLGHGLLLFQRFGLCLFKALLLAFMKFVFQSHILVPRESVGFEIRHLFVDGFGFVRVHVLGCKVLHVGLYDRVVKLLIPRKNIKIFISEVVQANVCVLFSPVFKVVNREFAFKNVHWTQENDILGLETSIKVSLGKSYPVAHTLVIPSTLRQFFGINHQHLQIEGTDSFPIFIRFSGKDVVANALVICIETEYGLRSGSFLVVDFNVEQMLNEGLCDMLIAKNKPKHNRVGNVKFIKWFNIHLYSPIVDLGALIYMNEFSKNAFMQILQTTVIKNLHFATKGLRHFFDEKDLYLEVA